MVSQQGQIAKNPSAWKNFHLLETIEAGIELKGSEVKSLRDHKANLRDAFARIDKGQAWLYGLEISPYPQAGRRSSGWRGRFSARATRWWRLGSTSRGRWSGKLIGVLTGTGGISDMVNNILAACEKDTGARVVYSDDPEYLIGELVRVYLEEHHRRPSVFSGGGKPGAVRDAVCGMWVDPQRAARFDTEPGRYAGAPDA